MRRTCGCDPLVELVAVLRGDLPDHDFRIDAGEHGLRINGKEIAALHGLGLAHADPLDPKGGLAQPIARLHGRQLLIHHHGIARLLDIEYLAIDQGVRASRGGPRYKKLILRGQRHEGYGPHASRAHPLGAEACPKPVNRVGRERRALNFEAQLRAQGRREVAQGEHFGLVEPSSLAQASLHLLLHGHGHPRLNAVFTKIAPQANELFGLILLHHLVFHRRGREHGHEGAAEQEAAQHYARIHPTFEAVAGVDVDTA
mmetsp:Transcript_77124/g.223191  ORF Transcript_77124/g.223191 Transcript_77124/m.223191 type:complete len:257 (-) Transcript_77124:1334-2104(-)